MLIARYETDKSMYAVERIQKDIYGLCKLASWLKERDIPDLFMPSQNYTVTTLQRNLVPQNTREWWHQAALDGNGIPESDKRPPKRLRVSMLRPTNVQPVPTLSVDKEHPNTGTLPEETQDIPREHALISAEEPLSGPQICENLVNQYLEALYLSKTSLAYFAKGPISRVRAAFISTETTCLSVYELTSFLRSILLAHSSMDKKYREKLPEIVKAVPPRSLSDDEVCDEISSAKTKKGKMKKIKLSKDGMYPYEEQYARKWWLSDISSPQKYEEETGEERLKRRIGDLRIRETLAQLILMLEILALEALPAYNEPQPEDDGNHDESQARKDSEAKSKKRKPKKLQDIKLLIDLLLDKLCIWQSVEQDESVSFQVKPKYGEALDTNSTKAANGDRLRNFCIEVIIPL